MTVVIHHNPDCGTSRNVLAIIEAAGGMPIVVEHLEPAGPARSSSVSSLRRISRPAPPCALPNPRPPISACSTGRR